MWFFGLMFWLVLPIVCCVLLARWSWERWAMMGPRGYGAYGWWPESRFDYTRQRRKRRELAGDPPELEQQQAYIEALETRISELEERLDFTERLLQGRREVGQRAS